MKFRIGFRTGYDVGADLTILSTDLLLDLLRDARQAATDAAHGFALVRSRLACTTTAIMRCGSGIGQLEPSGYVAHVAHHPSALASVPADSRKLMVAEAQAGWRTAFVAAAADELLLRAEIARRWPGYESATGGHEVVYLARRGPVSAPAHPDW